MRHDAFQHREQAEEARYFAERDARLIERLRARAKLGEVAAALSDKLNVDEPKLLERLVAAGITQDNAAAFLIAPLIEVAWADGHVTPGGYDAVVRLAAERGVAHDSADMSQIRQWLAHRPPREVIEASLDAIRVGLSVLPSDERDQQVEQLMDACEAVARATAGVESAPAIAGATWQQEWTALRRIRARLTA